MLAATEAAPLANPETPTRVKRGYFVPSPSWPLRLAPQHFSAPAVVSAHVCFPPAATAAMPLVSPAASTGAVRTPDVPSPSCPEPFAPQHLTVPALATAHVSSPPAAIADAPLVRPATSTGVEPGEPVPSPNSP